MVRRGRSPRSSRAPSIPNDRTRQRNPCTRPIVASRRLSISKWPLASVNRSERLARRRPSLRLQRGRNPPGRERLRPQARRRGAGSGCAPKSLATGQATGRRRRQLAGADQVRRAFDQAHPDVEQRQRERIKADFPARGREDPFGRRRHAAWSLKPRPHPPGIVHDIGRAEGKRGNCRRPAPAAIIRSRLCRPDQPEWGRAPALRPRPSPPDDEQGGEKLDRSEANMRGSVRRLILRQRERRRGPRRPPSCQRTAARARARVVSAKSTGPITMILRGTGKSKL